MRTAGDDQPGKLVLNRARFAQTLARLADLDSPHAQELFVRLASSWGYVPGRAYITVRLTGTERLILSVLGYKRVIKPITQQESKRMAVKKAVKGKAAPKPQDDIDELAAELEGLEEIDDEEPEVEDDETEDDGEDLSTLTVAQLKAKAKEVGAKTTGSKATLIAAIEAAGEADDEEEEDDDEEDDEDEDDTPDFDGMSRAELKAYLVEQDPTFKAKKSQTDDDLRALCVGDDEDDEDEPASVKTPAKGKTTTKAPATKGKQPGQLIRALPTGKLGANDIAEMAGTSALNVRNFLRSEAGQAYPKDATTGRYAFSAKTAAIIAKKMKARGTTK